MAKSWRLGAVGLALAMICAVAPAASAVVVHSRGQFLGVTPRSGVPAAAIAGSVAATRPAAALPSGPTSAGYWENLNYQGGPVMHSSTPYLIFWAPSGESVPADWQTLTERYFTDVAADSTTAGNVYGVARQFTDGAGFADYRQTFDPASQVIQDSNPYPAPDTSNCGASPYTTCLTDGQLQSEVSSLIAARGLPTDGVAGASELPNAAPIYFVVLPSNVDVCFSDGSGNCASNAFCAYHSSYVDGGGNDILYAAIPTDALTSPQDAKGCQYDGNSLVQQPNGSMADVALKYISHEDNETITDPLGTGWWNDYTGNENGDNCNWSFTPTLGGDASAGTLYNQLISGHQYYVQSEWSNGGSSCLTAASGGTITPRFAVPPGPRTAGSALSFDPAASTGTYRFSSETWDWGDGSAATFHPGRTLTAAAHTYAAPGDYTVALTLVDSRGELSTATEEISVGASPTAAFTASPTQFVEGGGPVSFDATGSTTGDGASIVSYAWDFGDGASGQGAVLSHPYPAAGTFLARLTVTDSLGRVDTATSTITVLDEPPVAGFTIGTLSPEAGQAVSFDGTGSSDSDGSIAWYAWSFGDGHWGSGGSPTHAYAAPGTYPVTLTVTDSAGQQSSVTEQVTVSAGPAARFDSSGGQPVDGSAIGFDAAASAGGALSGTIVSYVWAFGDGATATGPNPGHAYSAPGTYTVTLTVTDAAGASNTTTQSVTVADEPPSAAFITGPAVPVPGQAVAFDAGASSDPDGAMASYAWDFGDGATGSGPAPSHTYAAPGTYTVTLTVLASGGQRATVTDPVTVYSPPASAFTYAPGLPVEGVAASFAGGAFGVDPGTMTGTYVWSFGDGTSGTGVTASHVYAQQGTYRVTLTVTGESGLTSATTQTVTVTDAPPIAAIALRTTRRLPGHPVAFSGSPSHDADDPIVSYLWHFPGGAEAVGKNVSHVFSRDGSYRVSLTVRDSFGETATTTVAVTVGRGIHPARGRRSNRHGRP